MNHNAAMNDSEKSIRGYDRLARVYRPLERSLFRGGLQESRVALLGDLPESKSALVLGDGDGRLLEQLCHTQPRCRITSVDQSGQMLRLQRQRIERAGASQRVELVAADARDFRPMAGQYDLLVTAFFLDCFGQQELPGLLRHWLSGVRAGGFLYFVDFCLPRSGWRRYRAASYLAVMHGFFRWQTGLSNRHLVDLDGILREQSVSLVKSIGHNHDLIVSRLYRVDH
jgi:ubiquinone/menaquinone biosynthesis C-methylase UbiE